MFVHMTQPTLECDAYYFTSMPYFCLQLTLKCDALNCVWAELQSVLVDFLKPANLSFARSTLLLTPKLLIQKYINGPAEVQAIDDQFWNCNVCTFG